MSNEATAHTMASMMARCNRSTNRSMIRTGRRTYKTICSNTRTHRFAVQFHPSVASRCRFYSNRFQVICPAPPPPQLSPVDNRTLLHSSVHHMAHDSAHGLIPDLVPQIQTSQPCSSPQDGIGVVRGLCLCVLHSGIISRLLNNIVSK